MLEGLGLCTIRAVLDEVRNNVFDSFFEANCERLIHIVSKKKQVDLNKDELRKISAVDRELLFSANAVDCLLITDDRAVRSLAKENGIKTLITPTFIELLVQRDKFDSDKGVRMLESITPFYIREKLISKSIRRLKCRT
jgi:predicted nucleic acid-binding protein